MAITTIRPASVQSDGYINSASATYSTARGAYTAGFVNNGGGFVIAGQRLNGSSNELYQAHFGNYDLSSIPSGAIITGVDFECTTNSGTVTADVDMKMLGYDAGGFVTSADFRNGTTAAGLTSYGDFPATSNNTTTTTWQAPFNAAGIAAVQAAIGGTFGFVLIDDDFIAGTPPAGDGRYLIRSSEDATEAYRPALIITWTYELAADQGALTLSGQAAGTRAQRKLAAGQGSFSATGQDAALSYAAVTQIAAETGAVALGGQAAGLRAQRRLGLDHGSATLGGQDAALRAQRRLGLDHGSATLAGQDAAFRLGFIMTAGHGAMALAGFDLAMSKTRYLLAAQAAFLLTGQDAALSRAALLTAAQAVFVLTGQNAALLAGYRLALARGDYTLAGEEVDLFVLRGIAAAYAAFVLSGQAAGFEQTYLAPSFRRLSVPAAHAAVVIGADGRTKIVGAG